MDSQLVDGPINPTINQIPVEPALTPKQRRGIYVLIVIVVVVLLGWYWQISRYVALGLYGGIDPAVLQQEAELNNQKLQENQARLDEVYNKDTDGDQLPDWEETNIYKSSPFLPDTDGDGFDDKLEVDNKTNPVCPEGKECIDNMTTEQQSSDVVQTAPSAPSVGQDQLELLKQAFGDNPDTNFLRSQLLSAASNEEQKTVINGLSDQQLMDFYKEMIQGPSASSSPSL